MTLTQVGFIELDVGPLKAAPGLNVGCRTHLLMVLMYLDLFV